MNPNPLPPLKELLAEFDSGKLPRSGTWHSLINGLYLNLDKVNEIEGWYQTVQEQTAFNQELANTIGSQYGQIEIWYGEIQIWQGEIAANKASVDQSVALTSEYSASAKNYADMASANAYQARQNSIEAQGAARDAINSAASASSSEINAINAATEAKASETVSDANAKEAALSKVSASASENNAASAASSALSSRNSAEGSKNTATEQAKLAESEAGRATREADRAKSEADSVTVREAPVDDRLYARKNADWEAVPPVEIDEATPDRLGLIYDAPRDDKKYARKNGGWTEDIPVGLPIGSMIPYSGKTAPMGWLWIEPVTIYQKADYPALYAHFQTHCPHLIIDDSTFRLAESRGMFLRGYDPTAVKDPDGADRDPLTEQIDTLKSHDLTKTFSGFSGGSLGAGWRYIDAEKWASGGDVQYNGGQKNLTMHYDGGVETRPQNLNALWIIKAYDAVLAPEQLQAKAVIDQVNANAAELISIKESLPVYGYTLLDFGTVNKNSCYVKPNPFGNSTPAIVFAEVYYGSKWAGSGWTDGRGTWGHCVIDDGIVIQTGQSYCIKHSVNNGGGHGMNDVVTSMPCRAHVWRLAI